jgi:SAM-dependent methyltransferase
MNGHPGGQAHTRRMLELAALERGARILDMGAGAGETLRLLRALGFDAVGVDLSPRAQEVLQGDFLAAPFPDGSFDAVLSQCAFFVSGDVPGALREAHRVLRPGGTLMLSDVFFEAPAPVAEAAGFELLQLEDMTGTWQEYYLEALWREEDCGCEIPRGKCGYWLMISRKV